MNLSCNIKKNEGYISTVYKDSLGIDTIGYGFAIKDLELEEDICEMILERKIKKLEKEVSTRFSWFKPLPIAGKEIILEMCYQMGVTGVSKFKKTIAYMVHKEWENASLEMLDSKWAVQTPGRAKELSFKMKKIYSNA